MKILIVEDEIKTDQYLRQGLHEAGFNSDLVHNGLDGLHLAQEGDYDLVILEVMLPDNEARALFDYSEALAEEKQVQLKLAEEAEISGDRLMLCRALNNLLSNTIRYTPPGESVVVDIKGDLHVPRWMSSTMGLPSTSRRSPTC